MSFDIINSYLYLPKKKITNKSLEKSNPDWKINKIFVHSGVKRRFYASKNETSLDLAMKACKIAKHAYKKDSTLKEAALELKILTAE